MSEELGKELLQDLFLKFWNTRAQLDPYKTFSSFPFGVSENIVLDVFNNDRVQKYNRQSIYELPFDYNKLTFDYKMLSRVVDFCIINRKMKKVFITGGSGFVGQNLIPLLIAKGYTVNALARSQKSIDKVKKVGANAIEGDLDSLTAIKKGVKDCDSVFHLAASVDFWATSEQLWGLHVVAVQTLLEEARKAGVKNFVYLSAASVIITGKPINNADETFVSNNLIDGYSQTKLEAEKIVLRSNTAEFKTISIRPPLIWGKGDQHVLPSIIHAIETKKMQLIDGGLKLMATCHVKNVCEGLIDGDLAKKGGEAYFITDGESQVMKDFIGKYVATQGVTLTDKQVSLRGARIFSGVMDYVWKAFKLEGQPPLLKAMVNMMGVEMTLNDNKARREIGYKNVITVEQGLNEM